MGELLETRAPNNCAYRTVCIDDRGASGKTTLADLLAARLPGFDVVHGDDYFEPHKDPVTWGDVNEERLEAELLAPVRAGARPISSRPYDFPRDGAMSLGDRARAGWEQVRQPREDRHLETMSPASHPDPVLDGTRPFDVQRGEGFGAQES